MSAFRLLVGDALEQLRTLPDESVRTCVTSPPYWGLRDYGVELNPAYAAMAERRSREVTPSLFLVGGAS